MCCCQGPNGVTFRGKIAPHQESDSLAQPLVARRRRDGSTRQAGEIEGGKVDGLRPALGNQLGHRLAVAGALRMPHTLWPVAT
jgi:hypothetical protein